MADFTILGLIITQLLSLSIYSLLAPFYPSEARHKGIHGGMIGLVFSCYPIAASISSPLIGKYLGYLGRKRMLFVGCCCNTLAMIGFGCIPYMNKHGFLSISILSRLLQGFGAGCIGTSSFAIVAARYPDKMETMMGFMQTASAVGFMLGPLFGSVLYSIDGFSFLFFTYGLIFLFFLPFFCVMIQKDEKYFKPDNNIKAMDFIKVYPAVLDLILVVLAAACLSFLNPTLADHLETYNIHIVVAGIIFTLPTLSYIVVVIAIKYIHIERKAIMALGLFTIGLACIEIGPWKYSGLPHNLGIVIVASITFGIGYASSIIPSLPDMIDSSQTLLSQYEHQQVSDFIFYLISFVGVE
ncbi:unnamed protein product [Blepharisma stoltei]|uniref:Major facilitator superfamily (MFS) profile domain-containing protein n=1 Tax=Blepharisma stoltei TaxID=1481888 RepID=A0AAU9K377_9CILI|nr:unnamed protein product [Blepharisma stoltei]